MIDGSERTRIASLIVLDGARCKFSLSTMHWIYPSFCLSPSLPFVATYNPARYPASYHDSKSVSTSGDVPGGTGGGGRVIAERVEFSLGVRLRRGARAPLVGGGGGGGIGVRSAWDAGPGVELLGSGPEVRRRFLQAACGVPLSAASFTAGLSFCSAFLSIASRCDCAARSNALIKALSSQVSGSAEASGMNVAVKVVVSWRLC